MKKGTNKITIIVITILATMLFIACDKDKSTGPKNGDKYPAELVGTWHALTVSMDVIITTNSAQKVADVLSEGNGSLVITGDQQGELKYLFSAEEGEGILMVWVGNAPIFETFEHGFPVYILAFHMFLDSTIEHESMVAFYVATSENEGQQYTGTLTNLNYDPATFSVTANNLQLFTYDSSASVTVNGTLTNSMKDVPANTPTSILSFVNHVEMESINFSANGTFSRTTVDDEETVNTTGTWEVTDGDNLTIIEAYKDENNQTITDTMVGTFTISTSGVLTFNVEGGACDLLEDDEDVESYDEQDCINIVEENLFLEKGSLAAVEEKASWTFSKSAPKLIARSPRFEIGHGSSLMNNLLKK